MKYRNPNFEIATAAVAMLLALGSCSDEPMMATRTGGDNTIKFNSTLVNVVDDESSRSDSNSAYTNFHARKFDGEEMYLVAATANSIDYTELADDDAYADGEEELSRGSIITSSTFGSTYANKHVNLYAYAYPAGSYSTNSLLSTVVADGTTISPYITNEDLTINQSGSTGFTLTPAATHYWTTSSYRITFIGLFPSPTDYSSNYTLSTTGNIPKLTYTIEGAVANQRDVLVAQTSVAGNGSSDGSVNLALKHIMAGVSVSLDGSLTGYSITNVTFSNIDVSGTYNLASGEWESTTTTGTRKYDGSVTALNNDNGLLFMMVPQTAKSTATISITISKDGSSKAYSYTISGDQWEMGKTINYRLSVNPSITDYYLETDQDTMYFSWDGTPGGDGETVDKTYTAEGSTTTATAKFNEGWLRIKSYKAVTDDSGTTYSDVDVAVSDATDIDGTITLTKEDKTSSMTNSDKYYDVTTTAKTDALNSSHSDATKTTIARTLSAKPFTDAYRFTIGSISKTTKTSTETTTLQAMQTTYSISTSQDPYWDLSLYSQSLQYRTKGTGYPYRWTKASETTNLSYSTSDESGRATANCYMICHAGKYSLPCVYGNSIYQNDINSSAYKTGASGNALNNQFPNYQGGNISSNWINSSTSGSGLAPYRAAVLWTTQPGVITIETSTDTYYQDSQPITNGRGIHNNGSSAYWIFFTVNSPNSVFKPSNTVIGLFDSGGILIWSWHIWITPWAVAGRKASSGTMTVDPNVRATSLGEQYFIKKPLGYIELDTYTYAERSCKVTITQTDAGSSISKDVTLMQEKHEFPRHTCTYYQWGRKDPLPANIRKETGHMYRGGVYETTMCQSGDAEGLNITYYEGLSFTTLEASSSNATYALTIKNPTTYYTKYAYTSGSDSGYSSNRIPYGKNYYDVWGCTKNVSSVEDGAVMDINAGISGMKTVYDPCPVGFRVPACLEMPAITYDGYGQGTTTNKWINGDAVADEATLYAGYINTSASGHTDFVNDGGMTFYRAEMAGLGSKQTSAETWVLYAMGQYDANAPSSQYTKSDGTTVTYKEITGYGQNAYYWTSTAWASSDGILNHRVFGLQVTYDDFATYVFPTYGNTEFFGRPIMAIFASDCAVYY